MQPNSILHLWYYLYLHQPLKYDLKTYSLNHSLGCLCQTINKGQGACVMLMVH